MEKIINESSVQNIRNQKFFYLFKMKWKNKIFRILIAIWIIYSGIINLQTTIVWKDYKSRLWLLTLILAIAMIIAGIYILVNSGAILQTVGVAIVVYGIVDIIENIIFIKKVDDYLE